MTLSNFLTVLSTVVIGAFSVVTALVAMFTTNVIAGWIVLAFVPILLFVIWLYSQKSSRLYRNYRERLSRINANLNESIEGVSIIQQFNQEKRMTNQFEGENGGLMNTRFNMIRINSLLFIGFSCDIDVLRFSIAGNICASWCGICFLTILVTIV